MEPKQESKLENLVRTEKENILIAAAFATVAMPVCAVIGSYLGEGAGYLWGNLINIIPGINAIAPWMAERSGLISDAKNAANLNENLYQTTGAIGGFWYGLWFPWKLLTCGHEKINSPPPKQN